MPLVKNASKEAVSENIRREVASGVPQKQAVAIALDVQRRAKRKHLAVGGLSDDAQGGWWQRQKADPVLGHGLVPGPTGGRTDALHVSVPSGSYVIPADVVSSFGEGNTANGARNLDKMFAARAEAPGFAKGGATPRPTLVPVALSGGEYLVDPAHVAAIGGGDLTHGQDVLDALVKKQRAHHIKTLKELPGPAR